LSIPFLIAKYASISDIAENAQQEPHIP